MPGGPPLAKSPRGRAPAGSGRQRFVDAPDIPTLAEQGLPQYEAVMWQGFFAPASLPAELGARIARDVRAVLALPETRAKLRATGVEVLEDDQAGFQRYFLSE